jgi:hypothetical protein
MLKYKSSVKYVHIQLVIVYIPYCNNRGQYACTTSCVVTQLLLRLHLSAAYSNRKQYALQYNSMLHPLMSTARHHIHAHAHFSCLQLHNMYTPYTPTGTHCTHSITCPLSTYTHTHTPAYRHRHLLAYSVQYMWHTVVYSIHCIYVKSISNMTNSR